MTGEQVDHDERARIMQEATDEANAENRILSLEDRVEKLWMIGGPLVAIAQNWKALATVTVVVAWLNRPGILAAIKTLLGVDK